MINFPRHVARMQRAAKLIVHSRRRHSKMKDAAEAAYGILSFGMHLLVRGLGFIAASSPPVTSLILAFPHVHDR